MLNTPLGPESKLIPKGVLETVIAMHYLLYIFAIWCEYDICRYLLVNFPRKLEQEWWRMEVINRMCPNMVAPLLYQALPPILAQVPIVMAGWTLWDHVTEAVSLCKRREEWGEVHTIERGGARETFDILSPLKINPGRRRKRSKIVENRCRRGLNNID